MYFSGRYDFKRRSDIAQSQFPAMKGFEPIKNKNVNVFEEIKKGNASFDKKKQQRQMKFIERMKKAKQLIFKHNRKPKNSMSVSISRKIKTQSDHDDNINISQSYIPYRHKNDKSIGYYNLNSPKIISNKQKQSNQREVDLRKCRSDFNPMYYRKNINQAQTTEKCDDSLPKKLDKHEKVSINLPIKRLNQILMKQIRDIEKCQYQLDKEKNEENKSNNKIIFPIIAHPGESLQGSIRRHKKLLNKKKDEYKFIKNKIEQSTQKDLQFQISKQEPVHSVEKQNNIVHKQKNIVHKQSIRSDKNHKQKIATKDSEQIQEDYVIEGWKSDRIVQNFYE